MTMKLRVLAIGFIYIIIYSTSGAQNKKLLSGTDSVIIKHLIVNRQFPDLSEKDTTNLLALKYNIFKQNFAVTAASGHKVAVIGFGANISHSQNFILFVKGNVYTIVGGKDLSGNILDFNTYLKREKVKLTDKQRLKCYDFLITNVEIFKGEEGLIKDPV